MPIRIPIDLPALDVLDSENIFAMDMERATNQDIRPMEVGILNLMPNKMKPKCRSCVYFRILPYKSILI